MLKQNQTDLICRIKMCHRKGGLINALWEQCSGQSVCNDFLLFPGLYLSIFEVKVSLLIWGLSSIISENRSSLFIRGGTQRRPILLLFKSLRLRILTLCPGRRPLARHNVHKTSPSSSAPPPSVWTDQVASHIWLHMISVMAHTMLCDVCKYCVWLHIKSPTV